MAQEKKATVKLSPAVNEQLERLKKGIEAEGSPHPTRDEIVSALICWTSSPQAAGMLQRFLQDLRKISPGPDNAGEDSGETPVA